MDHALVFNKFIAGYFSTMPMLGNANFYNTEFLENEDGEILITLGFPDLGEIVAKINPAEDTLVDFKISQIYESEKENFKTFVSEKVNEYLDTYMSELLVGNPTDEDYVPDEHNINIDQFANAFMGSELEIETGMSLSEFFDLIGAPSQKNVIEAAKDEFEKVISKLITALDEYKVDKNITNERGTWLVDMNTKQWMFNFKWSLTESDRFSYAVLIKEFQDTVSGTSDDIDDFKAKFKYSMDDISLDATGRFQTFLEQLADLF